MQDSSYYLLLEDKSKFKQDDAPYLDLVSKSNVSEKRRLLKSIDITINSYKNVEIILAVFNWK